MRAMRTLLLLAVFTSLCCFLTIRRTQARSANLPGKSSPTSRETVSSGAPTAPESGGIRESISSKHQKRYQEWKDEFLSTDIGRAQWEMYAHHPRLVLTITMSDSNPEGASTGKYKWNQEGELVAATITLGNRADQGFPTSVYYPVMNALQPFEAARLIGGNILAVLPNLDWVATHLLRHLDQLRIVYVVTVAKKDLVVNRNHLDLKFVKRFRSSGNSHHVTELMGDFCCREHFAANQPG